MFSFAAVPALTRRWRQTRSRPSVVSAIDGVDEVRLVGIREGHLVQPFDLAQPVLDAARDRGKIVGGEAIGIAQPDGFGERFGERGGLLLLTHLLPLCSVLTPCPP